MSIFQPTNITPSVTGPLGNGTVDASQDLTVSWQVNGNSAMTAFSITIYQNDSGSTQVYSTGKRTDRCPFYGVDGLGEYRMFSYTIPKSALSGAGVSNGNAYKLVIRQWWSQTDFVDQYSASAFVTRSAPSLQLGAIPDPMTVKQYTFTAVYSQAQGDGLNWVRWQIALADSSDSPFYDSGEIYGTAQLECSYDGFFPGAEYAVRCTVQTENGVEADTGFVPFAVQYASSDLAGYVETSCTAKSGVRVSWPRIAYIPGEGTGDYILSGGTLTLPAGSSVFWDKINGEDMAVSPVWAVIWSGVIGAGAADLFRLETAGGPVAFSYDPESGQVRLTWNQIQRAAWEPVFPGDEISAVLTDNTLYLLRRYKGGGLYPALNLYPSTTLYPNDGVWMSARRDFAHGMGQGTIQKAGLYGVQVCRYFQIFQGKVPQSVLQEVLAGSYVPIFVEGTVLLTDFSQGIEGGNLRSPGEKLVGVAVYRQQGERGQLNYLTRLSLSQSGFVDYGAVSQQGPYSYYIFPVGATTYLAQPIVSPPVYPCWWDWTVLECEQQEDGTFLVEGIYSFGKNLTSGAMTNNNSPELLNNFTPYPLIQSSPSNYKSGVLQSLIGAVKDGEYLDTLALRDAIFALSVSQKTLFLKSRKGDLLRVRLSAPVSMETMDNTREQAQTASLSWAEIGSGEGAALVGEG